MFLSKKMRTKEKEVKTVKLISETIPAEMNGCLNYDGMGEGRDTNKILKMLIHSTYLRAFWVTSYSMSYWIDS